MEHLHSIVAQLKELGYVADIYKVEKSWYYEGLPISDPQEVLHCSWYSPALKKKISVYRISNATIKGVAISIT